MPIPVCHILCLLATSDYNNLIYALNLMHNMTTYRYVCLIMYNLNKIAIYFTHSFTALPIFSCSQKITIKMQVARYECLFELMIIFIKILQVRMF